MPAEMFFMFMYLVDFVSEEAGNAGRNAALYVNNNGEDKNTGRDKDHAFALKTESAIQCRLRSVSVTWRRSSWSASVWEMYIKIVTSVHIWMENGSFPRKKQVAAPGEMEQIKLKKEQLLSILEGKQKTG